MLCQDLRFGKGEQLEVISGWPQLKILYQRTRSEIM
jgi:hypothetical protein